MTVRRLRFGALFSFLIGVAVTVISVAAPGLPTTATNQNVWISFVYVLATIVGCAGIVLALNALAWSFILPRLRPASPLRAAIVVLLVGAFTLVSIVLTFLLVLWVFAGFPLPGLL